MSKKFNMLVRRPKKKSGKLVRNERPQQYMQIKAAIIAVAVTGMTAVTVPAFALVQPAFAREAIMLVQRSLQNGNSKPETKLDVLLRELANLEVEKATLDVKHSNSNQTTQEIDGEIEAVRNRINEIQPKSSAVISNVVTEALVSKIAALEIENSLLEAYHTPYAEVVVSTENQIRRLWRRVASISPQNPKDVINPVVSAILDTEIATLKARRASLATRYTPDDIGEFLTIDLQLSSLAQRQAFYNS
ncbi:hypothetical protein NIES4071_34000 [Calothrix sp. NIES-4071]|nr:hypothetical protein NIES4071_34000 [Calothrix sp. NIES-4071]BAZ57719.1 hypothetical protein NIES4105_33930 [Calothrix sp. NIES-4105]